LTRIRFRLGLEMCRGRWICGREFGKVVKGILGIVCVVRRGYVFGGAHCKIEAILRVELRASFEVGGRVRASVINLVG